MRTVFGHDGCWSRLLVVELGNTKGHDMTFSFHHRALACCISGLALLGGFAGASVAQEERDEPFKVYVLLAPSSGAYGASQDFNGGITREYQLEETVAGGLALGADFGRYMAEVEWHIGDATVDKVYETYTGDRVFIPNRDAIGGRSPGIEAQAFLLNGWVRPFDEGSPLNVLYVGGGVGRGETQFFRLEPGVLTGVGVDEQDGLAWQVGGGLRYVSDGTGLATGAVFGVGFRYLTLDGGEGRTLERETLVVELGWAF